MSAVQVRVVPQAVAVVLLRQAQTVLAQQVGTVGQATISQRGLVSQQARHTRVVVVAAAAVLMGTVA